MTFDDAVELATCAIEGMGGIPVRPPEFVFVRASGKNAPADIRGLRTRIKIIVPDETTEADIAAWKEKNPVERFPSGMTTTIDLSDDLWGGYLTCGSITLRPDFRGMTEEQLASWTRHPDGNALVRAACCEILEREGQLSGALLAFATRCLGGEPPPKRRKGRPGNTGRDLAIVWAVDELCRHGMTATRNESSPATSACDAVARAAASLGIATTYEAIRQTRNRVGQK